MVKICTLQSFIYIPLSVKWLKLNRIFLWNFEKTHDIWPQGYRIAAFWSHIEFAQSQIYSKNPQNCHFLIRSYWHSSKLKNSKIETGTVWKFQNLSTIQISFVLNFCECLVSIFAISNILGTKYLNFGKFQLSKICTISSKSFFTSFKIIKLVIFQALVVSPSASKYRQKSEFCRINLSLFLLNKPMSFN